MQVRRFEAVDMQEALRLVKQELGPHAIILSTRSIKKGKGTFGLFGRPMVEVTAAVDREQVHPSETTPERRSSRALRPPAQEAPAAPLEMTRLLAPLQQELLQVKDLLHQLSQETRQTVPFTLGSLEREFSAVKKMIEFLVQHRQEEAMPLIIPPLLPLYQRLVSSGVEEPIARRLVEKAQNSAEKGRREEDRYMRYYFVKLLLQEVPIFGPLPLREGEQTVAAFVGPTGVGKTTTIAKLAAHYALGEKRKVALLTLDTYRIAAVEQLRTFAEIMGLSVDVVLSPAELHRLLSHHQDKDLILIDTAGRSQRDEVQMAELSSFFADSPSISLHLVLSATASPQNLMETVERFQRLPLQSLVFTKLDESNTFGTILSTSLQAQLPLSYLTTGQRVPEDIEVATPERIVDLLLQVSQWHD
ncbi:MAG: flagellar biosynthesis protein FlhF [Nitrospinota bacterium]|nr:MAG: flagellar biosynthesis protein FlhF [Nitrospinota bacterium]